MKEAVQTHSRALIAQFQHVAACNALHSVEDRLARWLLHVHDRVNGNVLPVTQETLAEFLGVRRTTVTQVAGKLRASGRSDPMRRSMIEIDRPRLEAAACECYQLMRRRIDRIILTEEMKPRGYAAPVQKFLQLKPPYWPRRRRCSGAREPTECPVRGQETIEEH